VNYSYDSRGLLNSVTTPAINTANYTWNDLGFLSRITDLNGNDWNLVYTDMGRLQSMTDPLSNHWQYTYDSRGRLNQTTFPDGETLSRSYDDAGNLVRNQYSDGPDLQYTYDELNRLTAANGISFTRDDEGRITTTNQPGAVFGATYDAGGRLNTITYNNSAFVVTYSYDPQTGLLSQVTDNLTGAQVDFTYDADRKLTGIVRSNGVNTTHTYDDTGRLTRIQDGDIIDLRYTLDALGQVVQAQMSTPLNPSDYLVGHAANFSYDNASQISSSGYTYDARGRMTASPDHTFTWNGASRLTGIDSTSLSYNGLGDLVTRTEGENTTHYYYNYALELTPIVAEQDEATGQFLRYYVWTPDGHLLYSIDASADNAVRFYHFDRSGSTLALTDNSGNVSDSYAYTPYGELLAHDGNSDQPFTFVGMWGVRQESTGGTLYHMRARYYDAATARFLSREPLWPRITDPKQLNPYQYALLDPTTTIDFTGLEASSDKSVFEKAFEWMMTASYEYMRYFVGEHESVQKGIAHLHKDPKENDSTSSPEKNVPTAGKFFKEGKRVITTAGGVTILRGGRTIPERTFSKMSGWLFNSKWAASKSTKELSSLVSKAKIVGKGVKAAGPVGVAIEGIMSSHELGTWTSEWILHGPDAAARKTQEDSVTAYIVGEVGKTKYAGAPIRWIGSGVSWLLGD
jgi:RHS repeat-associated protein